MIVEGKPGTGKSTKLPQYLFKDILNSERRVVCTEPRRMAARNLATRVAKEMESELGKLVGYRVRFEDCSQPDTAITYGTRMIKNLQSFSSFYIEFCVLFYRFVTEGILLRELESDPLLQKYAAVFLDDVHERSIHVDLLMGELESLLSTLSCLLTTLC